MTVYSGTVFVYGSTVTLAFDISDSGTYDAIWKGPFNNAPDPQTGSGIIEGTPNGDGSMRFTLEFSKAEFVEMLEDGNATDFYCTLRRSKTGKWAPSSYSLSIGTLTRPDGTPVVPNTEPENPDNPDKPDTPDNPDNPDNPDAPDKPDNPVSADEVKKLISKLPHDPYEITSAWAADVKAAEDAYNALGDADKNKLDAENVVKDGKAITRSYARYLEQAVWAVRSLAQVDNSTTLPDGVYTAKSGLASDSSMGKTDRPVTFKFSAVRVIVKGGKAEAVIEHGTSSPETLHMGEGPDGKVAEYRILSESGKSQFRIPVDLNTTFYFTELAKGAKQGVTDAISYEMRIELDEATAVPDPDAKETDSDPTNPDDQKQSGGNGDTNNNGNTNNNDNQSNANNGSNNNSGRRSSTNLAFDDNPSNSNNKNSGQSSKDSASKSSASASAASAKAETNGSKSQTQNKGASDDTLTVKAVQASATGGSGGSIVSALVAFAALAASMAAGAGAFVAWFNRRENRS